MEPVNRVVDLLFVAGELNCDGLRVGVKRLSVIHLGDSVDLVGAVSFDLQEGEFGPHGVVRFTDGDYQLELGELFVRLVDPGFGLLDNHCDPRVILDGRWSDGKALDIEMPAGEQPCVRAHRGRPR
ncbi:hypothetical protein J2752_002810 [Halarchaeum rubridurum]|uniref:Uncharacterized protein n=1 Tax=Halarchaeum rubridurum TaxID=489911 RepID=A0A8T4GSM6_9EURY|nr:hypothetical protein [Halarchaeum rubridurum]